MNRKTFEVVMLPTEKSIIHLSKNNVLIESIEITGCSDLYRLTPQHLYILSDEEIKIGDWVIEYQSKDSVGEVHFINSEYILSKDIQKKIIATTDNSLGLPLIHDSFLPPFIKAYNEGKQITEVDLEMQISYHQEEICDGGYIVKKRPDNTVIIVI